MDHIYIRRNQIREVLTPLSITLGDANTCGKIVVSDMTARDITHMALSVKSWRKDPTDLVVLRRCDLEFRGIDDEKLPTWFENRPTSEWQVFPSWGMYFRNVKKVETQDILLRIKGKDYRKAYIWENGEKEIKGIRFENSPL